MSLKVWLPLTGDLRNIGCSDIEVSNNGATVNDNGKIGKCYYFDGNAHWLQLSKPVGNLYSKDFSWAVWLKPTDSTRSIISSEYSSTGASNVAFELTTSRGVRIYWNGNPDIYPSNTTLPLNTWSHVAIVKSTNKIETYINGELRHTYTGTLSNRTSTSYIRIGDDYRGGTSVSYMGYINDWRLYDHALSTAEVEEIAKGLVLHYKLESNIEEIISSVPSTNVYSYPTFNTSNAGGGWSHWGRSGADGSYGQNTDKQYIFNKNNTYSHWFANSSSGTAEYLLYQSPAFDGGYRSLQCIVKEENSLPITNSILFPTWNARNGGVPNNAWTSVEDLGDGFYYCKCEGISQDGSNDLVGIFVKQGYKIYVSEMYLENNTSTCTSPFTYSIDYLQDSSGYNNNGKIISGTPFIGGSRYNNHIKLYGTTVDGSSNTLTGAQYFYGSIYIPTAAALTVAWWGKNEAYGRGGIFETVSSEFTFDGTVPIDYNITAIANWDDTFRVYNGSSSVNFYSSFPRTDNIWHYHAIVFDGTTVKYYKDGEIITSGNLTGTLPTIYGIRMGLGRAGGVYRQIKESVSDLRIYVTPLLSKDIKLLYNINMRIDNSQKIHTFKLDETTTKNQLTQTGILKDNIIEPYLTLSDGSYWKLMLCHYVDYGRNLFTSSNATDCNKLGLYSKLKDINKYTYDGKYEFYVIQDGKEFRWTQTSQPTASSITGLTTVSGYNDPVSGLAKSSQSNAYLGYNSWWGACGCWTSYTEGGKTGIPGFGAKNSNGVCSEYLILYTRIEKPVVQLDNITGYATNFIEI